MRFSGRVFRAGRLWAVEVSALGVVSQGRTRRDALDMIRDAIRSLVNEPGFDVQVYPGGPDRFEIAGSNDARLVALLLRRKRLHAGLTLSQVAERLGSRSPNAYARYEQGRAMPTVQKLSELLAVVAPNSAFVFSDSASRS